MLSPNKRRSLWAAMADLYGHKWASSYGDDPESDTAATWAKTLADLSPQQLADGLRACATNPDPWPPSLPEFRARCFGVPPVHVTKAEMLGRIEPSPFTRLAWTFTDSYALRHADAKTADRLIREAHDMACRHVMSGGPLPEKPVAAIEQHEAPKPKPAAPETAKAALDRLAAMLGQPSLGELQ
jgi:hypothetical protein